MSDALAKQYFLLEQPDAEPEVPPPASELSVAESKPDQDLKEEEEQKVEEAEAEEEEEGECPFCLFMKGGGCRESFTNWENCVEEAEKNKEDVVEKCTEVTAMLKQCMDAHYDYYEPILRAEKAAEQQVIDELEKEARSQQQEQNQEIRVSDSERQEKKGDLASDSNQA